MSVEKHGRSILGIDSLRFFAFLSVFISHAVPSVTYGTIGMDFFFVLSSFLLTYLALKELENTHHFSKTNFFIRRCLRIYPLYYLVLLFAFFVLPFLAERAGQSVTLPTRKYLYFFFLSNYDFTDHIFALKFLWSISVEEQFYILFIFLSPFFKEKIYVPIAGLLTFYVFDVAVCNHFHIYQDRNTLLYFPHFAAGMLAAKVYFDRKMQLVKQLLLMVICLLVIAYAFLRIPGLKNYENLPLSFTLAGTLLLTIVCLKARWASHIFLRVTEYLGKYTYGLYVYGGFVITLAIKKFTQLGQALMVVVELGLLFMIAWLSYHLYEKHFLKLKRLFRR